MRGIAASNWGVSLPNMVKLYNATVLPRLLYGCSTWAPIHRGYGFAGAWARMALKLRQFQREALAALTGAFKTTAGVALDVELHVEPIN